jgi:cytochrome b pre-mRNA-processing protein 3
MATITSKIREKAPLMTETYVAHSATELLVKECARSGNYTIPQALEKNVEIPRDETGAHLGVGTGWWYDSKTYLEPFVQVTLTMF